MPDRQSGARGLGVCSGACQWIRGEMIYRRWNSRRSCYPRSFLNCCHEEWQANSSRRAQRNLLFINQARLSLNLYLLFAMHADMTPYFSKTIFKFKQCSHVTTRWSFATVKCFWLFLLHKESAPPSIGQPGLTCHVLPEDVASPIPFPTYVQHDWSYWGGEEDPLRKKNHPGNHHWLLTLT